MLASSPAKRSRRGYENFERRRRAVGPGLIAALLCCVAAGPAFAWGQTGHRVTGAVAERYLSGVARANVQLLLGTESLAEAASWPDDMRSDPAEFWQRTASPFHFVSDR